MPTQLDDEIVAVRGLVTRVTGADRKYENAIYYRHPDVWEPGTPRERANVQAGWITTAGNNRDRMADLMERGFVPLRKFGVSQKHPQWSPEAQGTPDQYGPWGAILSHPEGPAAFPVSQILTYRWYDPKHCPVPGVVFPQLVGSDITEYTCPDCTDRTFAEALHLARHLRNTHEWTVDDLVKFGEAMGLDFRREFGKQAKRVVTYAAAKDARPPMLGGQSAVPVQPVTVERIVPVRSEAPAPSAEDDDLRRRKAEALARGRATAAANRAARAKQRE